MPRSFSACLSARAALALALTLCGSLGGVEAQSDPLGHTLGAFEQARQGGPASLYAFLQEMPKGADLHMHLTGAVYAETLLADAASDGLCVDPEQLRLTTPDSPGHCVAPRVAASALSSQQALYDAMIDALSMRTFVPRTGESGHDHFFNSFGRFGLLTTERHGGEWLAEITARAARQNEQYLEIMDTPPFAHAIALSQQQSVNPDFAKMRQALLDAGLDQEVQTDRQMLDRMLADRDQIQHCGTAEASPGCQVQLRFLYQVLRGAAPQRVFAQTLLGFEVAKADPRWVGINYVMPEDGYLSMRDYHLHMQMLDYLHRTYPDVHISLHAGELAQGLVAPDGLRFHIREAVELGHAERIGHGVDVLNEDHPAELLQELARKHVLVEINLTSNQAILGVAGAEHPLHAYRQAQVPTALSTDDEGVSRIDLTHEYVKAVEEQGLGYADLKQMARSSLEHSFLPGHSLWAHADQFDVVDAACRSDSPARAASSGCQQWLADNPKAAQQWQLEQRLVRFEASHG